MSKIMGKNKVVLFLIQIHFDYRSFFAIIFFHKKNIITSKWAILGTTKLLRMNSRMIKDGSSIIRIKKIIPHICEFLFATQKIMSTCSF